MRAADAPFPWGLFILMAIPWWLYNRYGLIQALICFVVITTFWLWVGNKQDEKLYEEIYAKLSNPDHSQGWVKRWSAESVIHNQIVKELNLHMAYGHVNSETGMQHYMILREN